MEFKKGINNKFKISPQPLFHKNFDLISQNLKQLQADDFKIFIASDAVKQTDRIASIFKDRNDEIEFTSEEQINIPQSVRTIIKKLTEKSSVDRYQSAEEVIEDIELMKQENEAQELRRIRVEGADPTIMAGTIERLGEIIDDAELAAKSMNSRWKFDKIAIDEACNDFVLSLIRKQLIWSGDV